MGPAEVSSENRRVAKKISYGLLKKIQRRGARKIDDGSRRAYQYVQRGD